MDSSEQVNVTSVDELEPVIEVTPALVQKRRSQGRIIFDRFVRNRIALGGAVFLILLFLFCFLGPFITGHNQPDVLHVTEASQVFAPPSPQFPFGTFVFSSRRRHTRSLRDWSSDVCSSD